MKTVLACMAWFSALVITCTILWLAFDVIEANIAPTVKAAAAVQVCQTWMQAGDFTIYRCENDETGEVIFHSSSGMMYSLPY